VIIIKTMVLIMSVLYNQTIVIYLYGSFIVHMIHPGSLFYRLWASRV